MAPVVGGIILIGGLVAAIAFRQDLWRFLKWLGHTVNGWVTDWIPDHQRQTVAIVGFAVVALVLNWLAHIRGRLRAWIFVLVVEAGLWLLFWYSVGIPSLNELLGLDIPKLETNAILISGAVVIGVTGAIFWFLETREDWRRYRHRTDPDGD